MGILIELGTCLHYLDVGPPPTPDPKTPFSDYPSQLPPLFKLWGNEKYIHISRTTSLSSFKLLCLCFLCLLVIPLFCHDEPSFTLCHDSGPSARPEQQLHCSLCMHGLAGWTSHSTSLSPSEESLALLLRKTAKPPFASRHPQFPLRQTPNQSKWLYHMLFNSCRLSLVHSPVRKLYISLH